MKIALCLSLSRRRNLTAITTGVYPIIPTLYTLHGSLWDPLHIAHFATLHTFSRHKESLITPVSHGGTYVGMYDVRLHTCPYRNEKPEAYHESEKTNILMEGPGFTHKTLGFSTYGLSARNIHCFNVIKVLYNRDLPERTPICK